MLKALVFDFDGVIGDTYDINYSLSKKLIKNDLSEQEFRDHHNGNVYEKPVIPFKPGDNLKFAKKQKEKFTKKHLFPLSGILKTLSRSFKLFVVSSSLDDNILYFLSLDGYDKYFTKIYGATKHTSKQEKFKMIFGEFSLKASECIFITDTVGDIDEVRQVDVQAVAVAWGYHEKDFLLTHHPLARAQNPEELLKIIKHLR